MRPGSCHGTGFLHVIRHHFQQRGQCVGCRGIIGVGGVCGYRVIFVVLWGSNVSGFCGRSIIGSWTTSGACGSS